MSCNPAGKYTNLKNEPTTQVDPADLLRAIGEARVDGIIGRGAASKDSKGEQRDSRETSEGEHHGGD